MKLKAQLGFALLLSACASSHLVTPISQPLATSEIESLLARVPNGAAWQDLSPDLQDAFRARAAKSLERGRREWGPEGLANKEEMLFASPSAAMSENIDRVLSVKFASELPAGFELVRDVHDEDLRRMLLRLYLVETSSGGYMLLNHPDF